MDNKAKIANRITSARKKMGITIKELAIRTETLSAARISNWEQGTRSPGPEEAKLLAGVLSVAASWILGLTDNPEGEILFPVKSLPRAVSPFKLNELTPACFSIEENAEKNLLLDRNNQETSHAAIITDNSMQPDFSMGDIVIFNTRAKPKPGDVVLAWLPSRKETVLRLYAETGDSLFQLLASNSLWAPILVKGKSDAEILGVVVEHRRYF